MAIIDDYSDIGARYRDLANPWLPRQEDAEASWRSSLLNTIEEVYGLRIAVVPSNRSCHGRDG